MWEGRLRRTITTTPAAEVGMDVPLQRFEAVTRVIHAQRYLISEIG